MNLLEHYQNQLQERYKKMKEIDKIIWKSFKKYVKLTDNFYYDNQIYGKRYSYIFELDIEKIPDGHERMMNFYIDLKNKFAEYENCDISYSSGKQYSVTINYFIQ